jgi:hypothetical protein
MLASRRRIGASTAKSRGFELQRGKRRPLDFPSLERASESGTWQLRPTARAVTHEFGTTIGESRLEFAARAETQCAADDDGAGATGAAAEPTGGATAGTNAADAEGTG